MEGKWGQNQTFKRRRVEIMGLTSSMKFECFGVSLLYDESGLIIWNDC